MSETPIPERTGEAATAANAPAARPPKRAVVWLVSGIVVFAFLLLDYFGTRILSSLRPHDEWWGAVLTGIFIGQVSLIAVWAVLAPGNLVVRLPWSLLLTAATWYAVVPGFQAGGGFYRADAIFLGVILFGSATIAQVPLWIAKKAFRWRLLPSGAADELPAGPWQFTLQHLLLATFLLAVALSPLRRVLPPPGPFDGLYLREAVVAILLVLGVFMVFNLLLAVPCIWSALASTAGVVPLALGWLVYCVALTGVELVVIGIFTGPARHPGETFVLPFLLNVGLCATVFGTLRIYRALGFRCVRAWPAGNSPAGEDGSAKQ
jgi:hypothetical protein